MFLFVCLCKSLFLFLVIVFFSSFYVHELRPISWQVPTAVLLQCLFFRPGFKVDGWKWKVSFKSFSNGSGECSFHHLHWWNRLLMWPARRVKWEWSFSTYQNRTTCADAGICCVVWTGGVLNFFIIYYLLFIILLHLFYLYFLPAFENCTNLTNQRFLFTILLISTKVFYLHIKLSTCVKGFITIVWVYWR